MNSGKFVPVHHKNASPAEKQIALLDELSRDAAKRAEFVRNPAEFLKKQNVVLDPDVISHYAESVRSNLERLVAQSGHHPTTGNTAPTAAFISAASVSAAASVVSAAASVVSAAAAVAAA